MADVKPDQPKQAVKSQHGGMAAYVESVPVHETTLPVRRSGVDGTVSVHDLDGCPSATRAYAWSSPIERSKKRQFFAVLHLGGIRSPRDAVRAAIVAEARSQS